MMNRYFTSLLYLATFLLLLLTNSNQLSAQVTEGFNYQAVARDALGEILPNTDIELRMSITVDPNAPGVVYSEEHIVTSDNFGMVNVVIGEGAPSTGDFDDIDWNDNEHFLMIRMEFDGTDATLPPVKFQAVPYAKIAATTSDKLWQETGEADMSIYYNDGPVGIGTLEPQRNLEIAQTFDDVFLRLHAQGSPAGSAMIELLRGSEFSATDWRFGNTGNGFAFQRTNDNFLTEPDETPLFISNSGRIGIGQVSPIHSLDIASNDEDYNTISIGGSLLNLDYDYNKPTLLFGIPNSLGGLIQNVDFRLVNNGNSFRLERSFEEFSDVPETMWSINDNNGNMNMHFHRIVDMADPTQGDHAVTLSFMNNAIQEAMSSCNDELQLSEDESLTNTDTGLAECITHCRNHSENGYSDWRVGKVDEYLNLVGINETPGTTFVWTVTPSSITPPPNATSTFVHIVNLNSPSVNIGNNSFTEGCRCIRGGK